MLAVAFGDADARVADFENEIFCRWRDSRTVTRPPRGVYFTAFDRRLSSTWLNLSKSTMTTIPSVPSSRQSVTPLRAAIGSNSSHFRRRSFPGQTAEGTTAEAAISIL